MFDYPTQKLMKSFRIFKRNFMDLPKVKLKKNSYQYQNDDIENNASIIHQSSKFLDV